MKTDTLKPHSPFKEGDGGFIVGDNNCNGGGDGDGGDGGDGVDIGGSGFNTH